MQSKGGGRQLTAVVSIRHPHERSEGDLYIPANGLAFVVVVKADR